MAATLSFMNMSLQLLAAIPGPRPGFFIIVESGDTD
jgi:hypothetical protein